MALREKKIRKTRKRISEEALQLFKRDGYEQTTMEAIAEAAEVSPSTLYRYFPTKNLILLDRVTGYQDISAAFSRHSANLPVEEALVEAILEWAQWMEANAEEVLLVRSLLDQAPIARAGLWDILHEQERDLSARLAQRLDLPEDDLQVVLSARLVLFTIISTVADRWRANADALSPTACARQVIEMFLQHKVLFSRVTDLSDERAE